MTIKEQILELLQEEQGTYLSGEAIGNRLNVSRSAIWKAIRDLKKVGHQIHAVTNKGYCLEAEADLLQEDEVRTYLNDSLSGLKIKVKNSVTSTNTIVKELGGQGEEEGLVLIANEQTQGRGRYGRSFHSPGSTGVYFSILLRPKMSAASAPSLTTMAAVAVASGIEEVFHQPVKIKWVNDLFLGERKVCGILTEGSFDLESNGMDYVVVGIGINVYDPQEGFPEDLTNIACSLTGQKDPEKNKRNQLVASCLNYFFEYYQNFSQKEYLEAYKKRSLVLGQKIEVIRQEDRISALALDIDEECRLLVQYPDGSKEFLSSGEVRILPL